MSGMSIEQQYAAFERVHKREVLFSNHRGTPHITEHLKDLLSVVCSIDRGTTMSDTQNLTNRTRKKTQRTSRRGFGHQATSLSVDSAQHSTAQQRRRELWV